jgi:hypothetical protein
LNVIDDYTFNYPVCEDGAGSAPPEDVGGEPGYEEFLSIIKAPSHPDHGDLQEWGEMHGYCKFDIREINRMLKRGG